MVVEHCVANKQMLVDIFQACGDKEFRFIEVSGFYFGFLFGLAQTALYLFYTGTWVLPTFGFIVGVATNFIALKVSADGKKERARSSEGAARNNKKNKLASRARRTCI